MAFAENLKYLMDYYGLSNYQLAKDLGCHQTSVANWLEGVKPQKRTLVAIANRFDITVEELVGAQLPSVKKENDSRTKNAPTVNGERIMRGIPNEEALKLLELLENRPDIRYLAAASERATPEHVKATARMFDELYGRSPDE